MKKSATIEKEIGQLQERRERLASDVSSAQRELEAARKGLISGTTDAAQVTSAQATFTALSEALAVVDGELSALRAELKEAGTEEQQAATVARIAELRTTQEQAQSEYEKVRAESNAALHNAATRMFTLHRQFSETEREISRLSPVQDYSRASSVQRRGLKDSPLRFGEQLAQAVQMLVNEEDRVRRKQLSREQTERQRQREARLVA